MEVQRVALVAGGNATRRSSDRGEGGAVWAPRARNRSEQSRYWGIRDRSTETIEETADLIGAATGGQGTARVVDHEDPVAVAELVAQIDAKRGRLDVLVNDTFGGDRYAEWDKPPWEHDLAGGLRMLRIGVDTHVITAHCALPLLLRGDRGLLVEMTDGTAESTRRHLLRPRQGDRWADRSCAGARAARPAGDGAGSDSGLAAVEGHARGFGVTEKNWRDVLSREPGFAISESPAYVARGVAALAQDPDVARFAGRVLTSHQLADR